MNFVYKFLLSSAFLTILVNVNSLKTYGDKCHFERCNAKANLYCNGSNCDCFPQTEMTFNGTTCVLVAGTVEPCAWRISIENVYEQKYPCVENSSCVPSGTYSFCRCLPEFDTTTIGLCVPKKYGTNCDSENDCGTDTNLICNQQKNCTCNSTISTYDEISHQCEGLLGANCDKFGKPCYKNMICENGACVCNSQFFENRFGECELKRGYNFSCEDYSNSCKSPFTCDSEFRCSCNSSTLVYDGKCRRIVGIECRTNEEEQIGLEGCVKNAECVGDHSKTCQCKRGYTNTSQGTCLVEHDGRCSISKDGTESCFELKATFCIEGRCSCIAGQVFDKTRRRCVAQLYSDCNDSSSCVENTVCAAASEKNSKQCVCKEGLVPVDNNCHPTVGQPCDYNFKSWNWGEYRKSSRICDPLALSLQCVNGICQCKHLEYYDYATQKCRGLIGAPCDLKTVDDNDHDKYCTPYAECVTRRVLVNKQGVCICRSGWKPGNESRCEKVATGKED